MIAGVITGLGILAILAAAAGFGGAIHPLGDSLAVFQLPSALTGMVMLMPATRQWFWPAAIVGTMSMLNVLWPKMVPTAPGTYTVYQKNLSFRQHEQAELAADILQRDTEIVTVQEVNEPNMAILEAIKTEYPTQAWCPFDFVGGTAVATKWSALGDVVCSDVGGLTTLKVQSPSGPVWLVSLHLHWPWPFGQDTQIEALLPVLEGLDAPIVLGGDFNWCPGATSYHESWRQAVRSIPVCCHRPITSRKWSQSPSTMYWPAAAPGRFCRCSIPIILVCWRGCHCRRRGKAGVAQRCRLQSSPIKAGSNGYFVRFSYPYSVISTWSSSLIENVPPTLPTNASTHRTIPGSSA